MPEPTTVVTLADGRRLACDDVGDPAGHPVIYVHGTPDSRQARHPDDEVASGLAVRLVAVDRPGFGHSSPDPGGTHGSFAADVAALADELGLDRFALLGWSAGALPALACAALLGERVTAVGVAAGLLPFAAYAEPGVLDDADDSRVMLADIGRELGPEATAAELAPYLVPVPITPELAREHVLEGTEPVRRAEIESVPGALDAMAAALVDSVQHGLAGITRDIELQILPPDFALAAVACPVHLWYGALDSTAPPSFGHWYESHLSAATLEVLDGAGHCFPLPRWADLLAALR